MKRYVLSAGVAGVLIALMQAFLGLNNGGAVALALSTVAALIWHRVRGEQKGGEV